MTFKPGQSANPKGRTPGRRNAKTRVVLEELNGVADALVNMSTDPLSDRTPDSILDQRERANRFRKESERIQAEQAAREQHQRDRQARHQEAAREVDDQVRAQLFLRVMQAREQAKPQPEVPPVPLSTQRQDETLEAEQAAGRRALKKYAKRSDEIAASVEEQTKEALPGFKT